MAVVDLRNIPFHLLIRVCRWVDKSQWDIHYKEQSSPNQICKFQVDTWYMYYRTVIARSQEDRMLKLNKWTMAWEYEPCHVISNNVAFWEI